MSAPPPETPPVTAGGGLRWLAPARQAPFWRRAVFGGACALVALVVRLPFEWLLGGALPYIFVFPAVTIAAVRGGVAASAGAVVVTVFYFVIDASTLRGDPIGRLLSLGLFIVSCALITGIAAQLRRAIVQLQAKELALQDSEARLRLLVRELEHRVKNSLALAGSLVKLTARHSEDLVDFRRRFEPRLQALAGAQTLLTQSDWREPDLASLVRDALAPFADPVGRAVTIGPGPAFAVPINSAVSLTLLLHELATNALKHGALAAPDGEVCVSWRVEGDELAVLEWVESGGSSVATPERKGFGSELFKALGDGQIRIERCFEPHGVACRIELRRV